MPLLTGFAGNLGNLYRRATGRKRSPAARRSALLASLVTAGVTALAATTRPGPAAAQSQQPAPQVQPPAAAAPEPPRQTFGAWAQRCAPNPAPATGAGEEEACFIMQEYIDPTSQRPVLKVTIGYFGTERQAGAVVAMPLGVPLARGLLISVDGKAVEKVPFQFCRRDGCQAFMPLSDAVVGAFKAGSQAMATVQSSQGDAINMPFSLCGFTAGFGSIK
jgi:invasion protein IalB